LIEETPSPLMADLPELRQTMGDAALRIAHEAGYVNAGTVEFVTDPKGNFYFLEVNKRIQVEHPITEEVTGIDLVKQQILIAMGEPLHISQEEVTFTGHALECRINAENPYADFAPSPGRVEMYYPPGGIGVRLDSHVYAGYKIPPTYDSMIAKLITTGKDRREAISRMSRALGEYMITGVKTTIPFEQAVMRDPNFRRGKYTTNFIENLLANRREMIERDA
jgi:acetyl-CoA carboxylase biotin carboxylase subunit